MKIANGFILREIAGSYVVVPVGENLVDFSSMVTTNETGAFLWECMQEDVTEKQLCEKLLSEYEGVDAQTAQKDVHEFVTSMKEKNILE